jgi:long-chain acyl-CoA synthetase
MIAPVPIEEALKAAPLISQVCMVGDGQKYLAALITLSESKLAELSKSNGALKERLITAPQVVNEVKHYVDQLNSSLASYEQIKKFAILSKEFSIV